MLTLNETRELGPSFNTAESGSSPSPSSDQLESTCAGLAVIRLELMEGVTHGRVEISFPAAATPIMVETPHPL